LADIYSEKDKKGGERSAANKPSTKKSFHNVTSKIDCGTKKKSLTASAG
jgi:rhodanese-related sulfurtransferase